MAFIVDTAHAFEVVYDITAFNDILYLPDAYIAKKDEAGRLTYIERKANAHTLAGYGFELEGPLEALLSIIDQLEVEELEKKFNPNRRRRTELEELLENRSIRQKIVRYCDQLLSKFLSLVTENELPLCLGIQRKAYLEDLRIQFSPDNPSPRLFFKKTEERVLYRLWFQDPDGREWRVRERDVAAVTNQPAWLLIDYRLHRLPDINGNLVKPFQSKDEIPIPKASVKDYFEKFIKKIAEKTDIDAEGFDISRYDKPLAGKVAVINHFIQERWMIGLSFIYPETEFHHGDRENHRSRLKFGENGDIRLIQIQRSREEEKIWVQKLHQLGLVHVEGSFFALPREQEGAFKSVEWLIAHRQELEQQGFTLKPVMISDQQLVLEVPMLSLTASQANDWFDLHGVVRIGEFEIPFSKIATNIAEGNPIYPLPDGSSFLIPDTWFHKYKEVAQIGKIKSGRLKIARSQFTLLHKADDLKMDAAVQEVVEDHNGKVHYTPSPLLKAELRPYQMEGVKWLVGLHYKGLGACLADDMGLGKTVQTIAMLLYAKEKKEKKQSILDSGQQLSMFEEVMEEQVNNPLNTLIVMPASLIFNWHNEIRKFAPQLTVYRHTGPKRHRDIRPLARFDVILTTYQTALRDVNLLEKLEYEYIVLDESQQIKNKNSKIFKAVNTLVANHKISLSGTPIENSLSDLWAQMQFINPNLLGSYNFFQRNFIQPIERQGDEDVTDQLKKMIAPYLLRRTKEMVAKDLPELNTRVFFSEMSVEQKRLYEKEKSAVRNYLFDHYAPHDLGYNNIVIRALTKLRQIANHPALIFEEYNKRSGKFDDIFEQLDVVVRGNHKVLIFSSFVQHLALFRQKLEESGQAYCWLSGENTAIQREKAIQRFEQEEDTRIFLISLKAGGSGLNLTAADYVFITDPWWNPASENQAIARAHRIGQTRHVFATKFITKDSIEEKILRLQEKKSKLFHDIIDGHAKFRFTKQELGYLLE